MREVAEEALSPFLGSASPPTAARFEGPELALSPSAVQALSMALHEMATNAAKHGALSVAGGSVALSWEILGQETLHLVWLESGGPAVVAPPDRRGFGATLIAATINRQLGGRMTSRWDRDGLRWEAWLPLARLGAGPEAHGPGRWPPMPIGGAEGVSPPA
jgi:two-component sensor histidine kinase